MLEDYQQAHNAPTRAREAILPPPPPPPPPEGAYLSTRGS